jgi:hypothetical protein
MNRNHGGSAFPHKPPGDAPGMTLRDYFAAKAMQGMLAYPTRSTNAIDVLASDAYIVADEMIKARQAQEATQ